MTRMNDAQQRKAQPITTGVLDYFPDALLAVAETSKAGNDQHNPGQPLHWSKDKSSDHADALLRHLIDRGTRDTDGIRHSAKVAWRALALLQVEIDREKAIQPLIQAVSVLAETSRFKDPYDGSIKDGWAGGDEGLGDGIPQVERIDPPARSPDDFAPDGI